MLLAGVILLGLLVCASSLCAQTPAPTPSQTTAPDAEKGEVMDGYEVHQSIEFGGHVVDFSGNGSMWDTFVNQSSGPRLLNQSLDMRSIDHNGLLFDELHESSFGYGGDPNNVTRFMVSKARIYTFSASFRRDRNYWGYDLLANPLNPPTSVPNVPVLTSPHRFEVVRRMTDINLTLAPQSPVRVRLGYARNVSEGPSFSSIHQGTEGLTAQMWRNGLDTYRVGVDLRLIPRTVFSYDQFISVFKGDTFQQLNSLPYALAGNIPVDLGLPFNSGPAGAGQPCATPILGSGFANPACNGYFAYSRFAPTRNLYPTEQFSFQTNYWKPIDISGRFSYTGAESDMPVSVESFDGLTTRSRNRNLLTTGPANARRITVNADLTLTWHVTDKLDFVDSFRWNDFRIPTRWDEDQSALFGATLLSNPNVFTPATCPPPFTAATCPQHNTSSGADLTTANFNRYFAQNTKLNTVELAYSFTSGFRATLGYRFRHRDIDAAQFDTYALTYFPGPTAALAHRGACASVLIPLNPDGSCTVLTFNGITAANIVPTFDGLTADSDHTPINEHALLFGFWWRLGDKFRATYDMELMSADNSFTRISPRNLQQYRLRLLYKPVDWANLSAAINIRENRNNIPDVGNLQHNRSYSAAAVFTPRETFNIDLNYNYNDVFSQTNICFVATPPPPGSVTCGTPFLEGLSLYQQTTHFFSANVMWRPVKRVTATLGYAGDFADGSTLILNPNAPLGPLTYTYHMPTAGVRVELAPRWSVSGGWNYYGYGEDSAAGPTLPRNFHGNVITTGLRYAF
ncbi:MAG: hypothetical protein M3P27_11645 [Acidobacteriota bacterium]|nr:hypothetical protein [Acidobacteriota bacterium]